MDFTAVPEILREPLARWWERAGAQSEFLSAYAALDESLRAELPRVAAASEFIGSALIQDPAALEWFARHEAPEAARGPTPSTNPARARRRPPRRSTSCVSGAAARCCALHGATWRGAQAREAPASWETLHALSDFAAASIRAAAAAAQRHLQDTFGRPRDAQGGEATLIVLGMGKLGGGS